MDIGILHTSCEAQLRKCSITIRRLQTCALHLRANYKVSSQTGIKGRKKFTKVKNIYLSQNLCIVGYENMNICYNNMRGLSYP